MSSEINGYEADPELVDLNGALPPTLVSVYRVSAQVEGKFALSQEFRSDDGWVLDGEDPHEAAHRFAREFLIQVRQQVGPRLTTEETWAQEPVLEHRVIAYGAWETKEVDPTHGQVDQDIQDQVSSMQPKSLGQRVALEATLQDRRDRRDRN